MKYSKFLKLAKKMIGDCLGREKEAMRFGKKQQKSIHPKPRFKRNAERLREKFEKRNGALISIFAKPLMMKEIKVIIEKSVDSYGAYAENVLGIYGAGDTPDKCKQSILDAIETIKTFDDNEIPVALKGDYKITYKFDTESLLNYYKGIFSNAAFERLTGINQKQMQHYSTGLKIPKKSTKKK